VLALGSGMALIVCLFVLLPSEDSPRDMTLDMDIPSQAEERPALVAYINQKGGYAFDYPSGWAASKVGTLSRIESPSGRVYLTFNVGARAPLNVASSRLVESLYGKDTTRELLGTRRERIAGAPTLLAGGTAEDEGGKRIRFLAISVRGQAHNYEISIVVPAESDARRLLPRLEEIVSSFQISE
jgi:hypothetical protein